MPKSLPPHDPPKSLDELNEIITRPTNAVLDAMSQIDGDFAVLGAGGKMGFHLCRELQRALEQLGRRESVTAVSRFAAEGSRQAFEQAGIPVIAIDLSDRSQLDSVRRFPNVFYLAGIKFGTSSQSDLLHRFNVMMPQMVADHFRESRIVALSTGCVYSFTTPSSGGSTETSAIDPPGAYAQSCLGREAAFVNGSKRHGTKCVLVRLNYSVELRYGVLVDIAQKIQSGETIDLETGYVNVIWQGDAITQILQCLPLAESPPMVINVTGSKVERVRDIAAEFGRRLGRGVQFSGREANNCWLSHNGIARERFGEPLISTEMMIDWIAAWLLRGGETLGKPTDFQVRSGNY